MSKPGLIIDALIQAQMQLVSSLTLHFSFINITMKQLCLCLSLVGLLFVNGAFAQFRVGVRAGYNSSTRTANLIPVGSHTPVSGWQAGLVGQFQLSEAISIQSAVVFTTKGFNRSSFYEDLTSPTTNPYSTSTIIIETPRPFYVEVPVLVMAKAPLNEQLKLCAGLGPYVGLAVGGTVQYDYRDKRTSGPLLLDRNSFYKRYDAGLIGATGLELADRYQLGIQYEYGLINVAHDPAIEKSYSRSVSFFVSAFLW
ncbi:MAG: PorT family protein [Cytophagaceae bacterium]|nr:MAG: PorT family protein [Cytophagaceae bacterium]